MADEISLNIQLTAENGDLKEQFYPGSISITQSALGLHAPVISIGTTQESIATGDISTLGVVVGRNLDATNYITIGPTTGGTYHPMQRVKAGETFAYRLEPGTVLAAKANTAPCKLQLKIFEN